MNTSSQIVLAGVSSVALAAALGCNQSHSRRARTVVPLAPAVSIEFPAGPAGTDAEGLRVRGTASGPRAIQSVRVNGVDATTTDNFAHWEADALFARGTTQLTAELVDVGGGTASATVPFDRVGRILDEPQDVTIDAATQRVFYVDQTLRAVVGIPLGATGQTFMSNDFRGSGALLVEPSAIDFDEAHARVIVFDSKNDPMLTAVDPATGDRTPLSGSTLGSGPVPFFASTIVVDAAGANAYVFSADDQAFFAIDLADGDRSIVSDAAHGSGPLPFDAAVALDESRGRLIVTDRTSFPGALVAVDLATGDRTVISDASTGSGPDLNPTDVSVAPGRDKAFVSNADGVLEVDLVTGDRKVVSSDVDGSGPSFDRPIRIEVSEPLDLAVIVDQGFDFDRLLTVDLATGNRAELAGTPLVGSGTIFREPKTIVYDAAHDRVLLLDENTSAIHTIDPRTGVRALASGGFPTVGSGPTFDGNLTTMAVDATGDRAFVVTELGPVYSIALASGDRTILSDGTHGAGPQFFDATAAVLDAARGRLLVTDDDFIGVIAVDLATGNRTVLTDETTGSGPPLEDPNDLVLDAANLRVLVTDSDLNAVVGVDLLTGNRTIVTGAGVGSGPDMDFHGSSPVVLDPTRGRFIVLDRDAPGRLLAVDLATGNRSVFADDSGAHGRGPSFDEIEGLARDTTRDLILACDQQQVTVLAIDPVTGDRVVIAQGVED